MTLLETLRALAPVVTPGEWGEDTLKSEGAYGSGDDTHEGFATTAIYNAEGKLLFDALNSDVILVQEEWDDDGFGYAYDLTSGANADLIVTLRNALPAIIAALETAALVRDEDWLAERIAEGGAQDWATLPGSYNGRMRQRDYRRYARAIIAALPKEEV